MSVARNSHTAPTMAADELEAFAETERLGRLYTGGGVAVTADGAHVACGCEGALQRFEGLTSFKKLKEHLKDQMAPIVYPIFLRVQVADTHTISMHVHSDTSVASIVNRLAHPGGIVGVPADKMRLVYKGKCLADEDHMVTHGIERDATIEVRLVNREHQTTSFHQRVIEKRKAAEEAEAAAAMPPPAKKPCRRGPARNARERRR